MQYAGEKRAGDVDVDEDEEGDVDVDVGDAEWAVLPTPPTNLWFNDYTSRIPAKSHIENVNLFLSSSAMPSFLQWCEFTINSKPLIFQIPQASNTQYYQQIWILLDVQLVFKKKGINEKKSYTQF